MDSAGDLEQRKAVLDAAERGLALLGDQAVSDEWPADERAALADERDTLADENDVVAVALDGRADRRDFDAALRQAETDVRVKNGSATDPRADTSSFGTYMAALDRKGTVADRKSSASDRKRSAADRKTAAGARRRAAVDRDEAGAERARIEMLQQGPGVRPAAVEGALAARRDRRRRAAGA
jgi:hypothetical protein